MARERDEGKRQAILAAAKRLFAANGFHRTSVSDIARETGLPVGSIYTYFQGKDEVARSVVDEGWEEFYESLAAALGAAGKPEDKLALVVYRFLPSLFRDVDLISIILAEADRGVALEEKLERLAGLVGGLISELAASRGIALDFGARTAMAAIAVYFLGALDTVRVSRNAGISVGPEDVLDFIRMSIENSFGISIVPPPPDRP
jgi:AcrR family transcriptional regulator